MITVKHLSLTFPKIKNLKKKFKVSYKISSKTLLTQGDVVPLEAQKSSPPAFAWARVHLQQWGEEGDTPEQNLYQNHVSCLKVDFSLPAIGWSQKFTPRRNVAELFNLGLEIGIKQVKFSQFVGWSLIWEYL